MEHWSLISARPLEFIFIVDVGGHFLWAKKISGAVGTNLGTTNQPQSIQAKRPLPTDIAVNTSNLTPKVVSAKDFMEAGDVTKMEGVVVAVQLQEAEENPSKRARSNEPYSHP